MTSTVHTTACSAVDSFVEAIEAVVEGKGEGLILLHLQLTQRSVLAPPTIALAAADDDGADDSEVVAGGGREDGENRGSASAHAAVASHHAVPAPLPDDVFGRITSEPRLSTVAHACQAVVDNAIASTWQLPAIAHRVLPLLRLPASSLPPLPATSPRLSAARARLSQALATASHAARRLFEVYAQFDLLADANVDAIVSAAEVGHGRVGGGLPADGDDSGGDDDDSDTADDDDQSDEDLSEWESQACPVAGAAPGGEDMDMSDMSTQDLVVASLAPCAERRGLSLEQAAQRVRIAGALVDVINVASHTVESCGLIVVDCSAARDALADKARALAEGFAGLVGRRLSERALLITRRYSALHEVLSAEATTAESVAAMEKELDAFAETMCMLEEHAKTGVVDCLNATETANIPLADEAIGHTAAMATWPEKLESEYESAAIRLDHARKRAMDALLDAKAALTADIDACKADAVVILKRGGSWLDVDDDSQAVLGLGESLTSLAQRAALCSSREALFGWPITAWTLLQELKEEYGPFHAMWHAAAEVGRHYPAWFEGPLLDCRADDARRVITWALEAMRVANASLSGCPNALKTAAAVSERLDETKTALPLLEAMLTPGMRGRHWDVVKEKTEGIVSAPTQVTTLRSLVQHGALEHLSLVGSRWLPSCMARHTHFSHHPNAPPLPRLAGWPAVLASLGSWRKLRSLPRANMRWSYSSTAWRRNGPRWSCPWFPIARPMCRCSREWTTLSPSSTITW